MNMKVKRFLFISLLSVLSLAVRSQTSNEEKAVIGVIQEFFILLENQDSISLRKLHLDSARFYIVAIDSNGVRTTSRDISRFHFRKEQVIKERMREKQTNVQINGHIAAVWAPYDLWINDKFSHCGVDVFTLLKTNDGWKIATCSYTIDRSGCSQ